MADETERDALVESREERVTQAERGSQPERSAARVFGGVDGGSQIELWALAADLSPAGMLAVDEAGTIVLVNREIERMFGYSREELLGKPVELLVPVRFRGAHPESRAQYAKAPHARPMGIGRDLRGVRKDGTEVPVEIGLNPVHADDRTYVLGSVVDITARREVETRLRQSQKMEAIGTLASGIAHDFNNILLGISGYTELTLADPKLEPAARADLQQVLRAAARGRELVQRILTFSRKQDMALAPLEPADAIEEAVRLLRASLPSTIELRIFIDDSTPTILSQAALLGQIVVNLVNNSAHAMRGRGLVEIQVDPVHVTEALHVTAGDLTPRHYCRIRVRDTGPGMSPAMVQRIFEPFFTTKPAGEGTGLGLSVVLGTVEAHGGAIDVVSKLDEGTTITIYLPAANGEESDVARSPRMHAMIVDDEPSLAEVTARALRSFGISTSTYSSSPEALEAFRAQPNWFDVVVTDNTMPQLTGFELAKRMKQIRPDVTILMVSGVPPQGDEAEVAAAVSRFLDKPFTLAELKSAIEQLVGPLPPTPSAE